MTSPLPLRRSQRRAVRTITQCHFDCRSLIMIQRLVEDPKPSAESASKNKPSRKQKSRQAVNKHSSSSRSASADLRDIVDELSESSRFSVDRLFGDLNGLRDDKWRTVDLPDTLAAMDSLLQASKSEAYDVKETYRHREGAKGDTTHAFKVSSVNAALCRTGASCCRALLTFTGTCCRTQTSRAAVGLLGTTNYR